MKPYYKNALTTLYEVSKENTYKEYALLWIEYHKNFIKISTYANYKQTLYKSLIPFFGNFKLKNINKMMIQSYIVSLNVTTKTIKDYVIVLKQSLNYLFENEIIDEFSFKKIKYKPYQKKKIEFLEENDYKKLKKHCIENFNCETEFKPYLAILLALSTGMRIGEISALKFKDIDYIDNTINVNRTLQRIYTPDEKTKIVIGTPKSSSSIRKIPLANDLKACLKKIEYIEENYVVRNETPAEPRIIRKKAKEIMKDANVKIIKFHSLRHTFATMCISLNVDIKTLSELLGHANAKMTLDIYTHTTTKQKQKAIDILQTI